MKEIGINSHYQVKKVTLLVTLVIYITQLSTHYNIYSYLRYVGIYHIGQT